MSPSFLQTLLNPILNASQDIRDITLHVVVVKSQKTQTQILQILLTHLITGRLLSMALTIYLDDESQLRAIEVHDVLYMGLCRKNEQPNILRPFNWFQRSTSASVLLFLSSRERFFNFGS